MSYFMRGGLQLGDSETWGTASYPLKSAAEMRLDTHLAEVPENGLVVDVGAGIGLSLEAAIHVSRPDIRVVGLDPGFNLVRPGDSFRSDLEETVNRFPTEQGKLLQRTDIWHRLLMASFAEEIPVRGGVSDLVVSYATLPEYTINDELALAECMRILKLGRAAVFGPIRAFKLPYWDNIVQKAAKNGIISGFSTRAEVMDDSEGRPMNAHFTTVVK